jgi:hypothetical protein
VLIFEIYLASFLISCFNLKISCEIKEACCHAGRLSHALIQMLCFVTGLGFLDIVETAQLVMETMLLKYRQLET